LSEEIHLKSIIKNLPELAGVYKYYDVQHKILYVGKAKNLKKRVSSYFNKDDHNAKTKLLVKKIHSIEYTIVPNEKDALLLENALIKELQPKYNINLRDDKSYPYIKIFNERFPRISFTRNKIEDNAHYFGPYTSVHNVRYIFELFKRMYPIRTCSLNLNNENIDKKKYKVCLEYHIGNCLAPCVNLQTEDDYNANINQIENILKGKTRLVREAIKNEIQICIEKLNFEQAAKLKIQLDALNEYIENSIVSNLDIESCHVFGYAENEYKSYINYLYIYEGNIIKTKSLSVQKNIEETKEDILTIAIIDMLGKNTEKSNIFIPFEIEIEDDLLICSVPKIGEKKKLVDLSNRNAMVQLQKSILHEKTPQHIRILDLMQKELKLHTKPFHIECFDNSNFQGSFPVSACVVFKNAKPSKKDYRHFHVKTVIGANDFDTMKEAVYRRYKRLLDEGQALPQLVVIDGGKGQLSAAMESIVELNLQNKIQIISIAKRLEEIYYPNDEIPLHLSKKSETLKIIQHIRDEAHRFGITFHRKTRDKNTLQTELTNIEGIGEKTAQKLLQHFLSIEKIKNSDSKELKNIVGENIATKIEAYFKKKSDK
jgi:excinuclease ABC subunit C